MLLESDTMTSVCLQIIMNEILLFVLEICVSETDHCPSLNAALTNARCESLILPFVAIDRYNLNYGLK
jgi:hypothetical protein